MPLLYAIACRVFLRQAIAGDRSEFDASVQRVIDDLTGRAADEDRVRY
jgi:hypothetical protein